jgi:hypothetical protein
LRRCLMASASTGSAPWGSTTTYASTGERCLWSGPMRKGAPPPAASPRLPFANAGGAALDTHPPCRRASHRAPTHPALNHAHSVAPQLWARPEVWETHR